MQLIKHSLNSDLLHVHEFKAATSSSMSLNILASSLKSLKYEWAFLTWTALGGMKATRPSISFNSLMVTYDLIMSHSLKLKLIGNISDQKAS